MIIKEFQTENSKTNLDFKKTIISKFKLPRYLKKS